MENEAEKSGHQKRFEAVVAEAMEHDFTQEQAEWLIALLNDYIPVV